MEASAAAKISQYEELVNENLKAELQAVHDERDAVYEKAKGRIGEQGIFEVCVVCGTYKAVGHVLSGFRIPVPEGVADPLEGAGTEPFIASSSPWGSEQRAPLPMIVPKDGDATPAPQRQLYDSMKKAMGGSIDKKTGGFTGPFNGFLLSPPLGRQLSKRQASAGRQNEIRGWSSDRSLFYGHQSASANCLARVW